MYARSFPQPDDVDEEDEPDEVDEEGEATTDVPPAVPIPRSEEVGRQTTGEDPAGVEAVQGDATDEGAIAESGVLARSKGDSSFRTAAESFGVDGVSDSVSKDPDEDHGTGTKSRTVVTEDSPTLSRVQEVEEAESGSIISDVSANQAPLDSKASLLPHDRQNSAASALRSQPPGKPLKSDQDRTAGRTAESRPADASNGKAPLAQPALALDDAHMHAGLVRFNLPDEDVAHDRRAKARLAQLNRRRSFRQFRRGTKHDGEIVKVEKMLVKVEATPQELSSEYDENESISIEAKTVEKWQEFVVVCRISNSEEADYVLQLYKTRVSLALPSIYTLESLWTISIFT